MISFPLVLSSLWPGMLM